MKFLGINWKKLIAPSQGLILALVLLSVAIPPIPVSAANPAVLSLSPSTGTFVVDSTFDVSVFLDTRGQSINAIELGLKFPPDKLQLVSSSTGKSIIGLWPTLPKYDNQTGVIELVGGIPNGIVVSRGLVTTLTFRAKSTGSAVVKFERSRLLANDGSGTETAFQVNNSLYQIILPPPEGPVLASDTHPDQSRWYQSKNVSMYWSEEEGVTGYSYIMSDQANDTPDDISEGVNLSVSYPNTLEGRRFFHIKALRDGKWGGVSHYAINIDSGEPADFELEFIPKARTTRRQPVIQFGTTDAMSGINHYELMIIPLQTGVKGGPQQLFIEASSPYITGELENGSYDVVVRAFDNAGNYREVTQTLKIVPALFKNIGDQGLEFRSTMVIPWWSLWIGLCLIILILIYILYRIYRWHRRVHEHHENKVIPTELQSQLQELQNYRSKYGKIGAIILFIGLSLFTSNSTQAQQTEASSDNVFAPPIISTLSRNINDEEIFYVGGTGPKNADIILFIQNLETSATDSQTVKADEKGNWFYRHDEFLGVGRYMLWAQSRLDGQLSPPSPQVQLQAEETSLHFGASRISKSTFYFLLLMGALLLIVILVSYIIVHTVHARRKHKLVLKGITETQESLRRGFAILSRDLQAELEIIKRAKLNQKLSEEEKIKEAELLKDLQEIEQYLLKEVWDLENSEHVS